MSRTKYTILGDRYTNPGKFGQKLILIPRKFSVTGVLNPISLLGICGYLCLIFFTRLSSTSTSTVTLRYIAQGYSTSDRLTDMSM